MRTSRKDRLFRTFTKKHDPPPLPPVHTPTGKILATPLPLKSLRVDSHYNECIYRVSQKKRNGGYSVPCELKGLYLFTSLGQTSSAEENNTKIIKFAWVVLILWPFLEIRSFSNFARFLRPMSEELCRE